MTTYTATGDGCYATVIAAVRVMLSRCAEVQSFLSAVDEAAALAAIRANAETQPNDVEEFTAAQLAALRPRVYVFGSPEEGMATVMDAVGSYDSSGTIDVVMERTLTAQEIDDDSLWMDAMQTTLGRATDELWQQVWTDEAAVINTIQMVGPFRGHEDTKSDLGDRTFAKLVITFGVSRQ